MRTIVAKDTQSVNDNNGLLNYGQLHPSFVGLIDLNKIKRDWK